MIELTIPPSQRPRVPPLGYTPSMSEIPGTEARLPIFALEDHVVFPQTDLELNVEVPRYRRLLRDLAARDVEGRWLGLVLAKPGWLVGYEAQQQIFSAGTAGRGTAVDFLEGGRATIALHGEFRFELEREVELEPYRQAVVHPVEEPHFDDRDAAIAAVRHGLVAFARGLAADSENAILTPDEISAISGRSFEELVNRLASGLELPSLRKLQLLTESTLDRALSLLAILQQRCQANELLRPYRWLASRAPLN